MPAQNKLHDHSHRKGHNAFDFIAICLSEGPQSLPQIARNFTDLPRRFGMFIEIVDQRSIERGELTQELMVDLKKMVEMGWVVQQADCYALTPLGQQASAQRLEGMRSFRSILDRLHQPQTVSKVSLFVHFLLALFKLPAGWLSGSVGLTNDALDTLLDGFSSIMVLFGVRYNKERLINIVLVLLMLLTGGFGFFQAITRFFIPAQPQVDWFTFLCAILSALLCAALGIYQRYVGLRSGNLVFITQSIDSRNHVIVAAGVTIGLIAALLQFPLLDTLVGLVVAILILKSALELSIETVKEIKGKGSDISRFDLGLQKRYDQFRRNQLRDWMLYVLEKEKGLSKKELQVCAHEMLDFSANPALRSMGLDQKLDVHELVELCLREMIDRGWLLIVDDHLVVTSDGKDHIKQTVKRGRYHRRKQVQN